MALVDGGRTVAVSNDGDFAITDDGNGHLLQKLLPSGLTDYHEVWSAGRSTTGIRAAGHVNRAEFILREMPLAYTVLPGRRAILVKASGVVTRADHERLVSELLHEEVLEEGLPVLIDGRGIESTISIRDLPHVVTLTRTLVKRGMDIIAIVADPGPVLVLAGAFELAARAVGVHVAVFEEIPTARVWLGLRKEDLAGAFDDAAS